LTFGVDTDEFLEKLMIFADFGLELEVVGDHRGVD
jgi:hypothetical protein